MLWYILQIVLSPIFPIFFKRIQGKNLKNIRVKGPVFIAMNHPNSFMDSMALTWILFYPKTFYMARGDVFKKGIISTTLHSIGLVPIFRFKDVGFESAKKNTEAFKTIYKLLDNKSKVMVFAEGISMQERRLLPLKKGTAKMAFSYLDQGGRDDLKIVPVGVTYSTPSKFRGDAYYQAGEAILVKDYYEEYKQNPAQTILKLTKIIEDNLQPLVPTLLHPENDLLIEQLQPILKKQFIKERKLNYNKLADQQLYWESIISYLNENTVKNPDKIAELRNDVNTYSVQVKQLGIHDHLVSRASKNKTILTFANIFFLLIGFPFYAVGKALNFFPHFFAKRVADKTCKDIEFYSAVNFGAGAMLFLILFPLELILVGFLFGTWKALVIYFVLKSVCGLIGLHYSIFRRKMVGAFRFRKIKNTNATLYQSLLQQRNKIVSAINLKG